MVINVFHNMGGALMGAAASLAAIVLWIVTFHRRFCISLYRTDKATAYGVHTTLGEAIRVHFWFLLRDLFLPLIVGTSHHRPEDRDTLEQEVEQAFRREYGAAPTGTDSEDGNVLIAHSCRSIFYYIIRSLLNNPKETKGRQSIRICLGSLHFGSFYRLLRGIEKSMGCTIEFYEVDFNEEDWTLRQDSIDEDQVKTCDLVMVQHIFGQPLDQERLVELAKKYDIPVVEDCVQSGSLFSRYRGYPNSDVIMYSGGLDKTPPCFGGGFALFRDSPWGNDLYEYSAAIHNVLPLDTWRARFLTCVNITIHLMIAKNSLGFNNLLGLVAYVWVTERGEFVNWYAMSFKVRKAKIITPFQHSESGFLRKPSTYQLKSMLYGLSKRSCLEKVAHHEVHGRELLLSSIPSKYHHALFPFLTSNSMAKYRANAGVSEFSWVVSPIGDRMHLCQFLNDHFLVSLVNTTWEANEKSKSVVGRYINDNLIYLPNINELNEAQTVKVGQVLTLYCQELEATGDFDFETKRYAGKVQRNDEGQ